MTKTERILEEVERTLGSWDEEAPLTPDPHLATRVQALHRERAASGWRAYRPFLQLRYAAILGLVLLNMFTIWYIESSPSTNTPEDLVSVLRADLQIEPSQETP